MSGGGVTVTVAVIDASPYVAVIFTVVGARTVEVWMRNEALRDPDATVTDAGTRTIVGSSLLSTTSAPPSGAEDASVTVAVGCPWPWTAEGLTDSELPGDPGAGLGAGAGDGAGDGAGAGGAGDTRDGEVESGETLPHCVTASVNSPSASAASSR